MTVATVKAISQPIAHKAKRRSSVLIIGSGIAGLFCAIKLARLNKNTKILIASKADLIEGSSKYAQGGIASVWSKIDTFDQHIADTLEAGAGLCDPKIVEICVKEGPKRVGELVEMGVPFTRSHSPLNPDFDLHREGGHSQRRILHADDLTGLAIETTLLSQARELEAQGQIEFLEHHIAVDLITEEKARGKPSTQIRQPGRCLGAYLLDVRENRIVAVESQVTVIATGGAGKAYLYTTNPDVATGDGIAIAYRAGAEVGNLEFMQFHPTCLFHPKERTFLISEALRGEGAILKNLAGESFMEKHHPLGCLAPRDIVARAIDKEMKRTGDKHVWLDLTCSGLSKEDIQKKFPNIFQKCLSLGIDITIEPIPVVPAAHYMCGGVKVDEHSRSTIESLYAIGEASFTGLHGANRLASNSLLEAVVFGARAAETAAVELSNRASQGETIANEIPEWDSGQAVALEEQIDIAATWLEVRTLLWNYVGIVRSNRRLERATRRLKIIHEEVQSYYWTYLLTKELIELRNLILVAELIVNGAQARRQSVGLHYTVDYP